jgi:hypothetical protein
MTSGIGRCTYTFLFTVCMGENLKAADIAGTLLLFVLLMSGRKIGKDKRSGISFRVKLLTYDLEKVQRMVSFLSDLESDLR